MSDKSENLLVLVDAVAILVVLLLIGGWSYAKEVILPVEHLLGEKLFDIGLALFGTLLGYWFAKQHIEHLMAGIVKTLDTKYLNLFRERAFHRAVSAMLPELPNFYLRKTDTFSTQTADAIGEFTHYSVALDPTHTPDKSMELVGKEAYTLAAGLIKKDMAFKEAPPAPNYEWTVGVNGLPDGWEVKEPPDLSIYEWNTGVAVEKYAVMKEVVRTATTVIYRWKWSTKDVPCGVYVGVTNYHIGGQPVIGNIVGTRLKISLKRENGTIIKTQEQIPWD